MPRKRLKPGDKVSTNITYRGEQQFQVRLYIKGAKLCETFRTKREAESWRDAKKTEAREGALVDDREARALTIGDLIDRYINDVIPELGQEQHAEKRAKVHQRETVRANKLKTYPIAQCTLADVSAADMRKFIEMRKAEPRVKSSHTIRLDMAILSRVCKLAMNEWELPLKHDPTQGVSKTGTIKRRAAGGAYKGRSRRLGKDEEEWLLRLASPVMSAVIRFAIATAMREDEIATLEPRDVNIDKRYAQLDVTKNSDPRRVPLSRPAISALKDGGRLDGEGRVFGLNSEAIYRRFARLRTAAKKAYLADCAQRGVKPRNHFMEDIKFHDLRHEAVSRLFEQTSLDTLRIAEITGHRTVQMLKRYLHLRDKSATLAALDAAWGDGSDEPTQSLAETE